MKKMPGTNFHDAFRPMRAYTPHAIHARAMKSNMAGLEGRLPGWSSRSGTPRRRPRLAADGSGAPPRRAARRPFFLRALATWATLVG